VQYKRVKLVERRQWGARERHGGLKEVNAHLQVQTRIERETDVIILLRRLTTLHFAIGDHRSLYHRAVVACSSSFETMKTLVVSVRHSDTGMWLVHEI
jgi:hypothetical protein